MTDVTRILSALGQGDDSEADRLLPLVYEELRKLAAARLTHEKPGQTLQATALVHEAYLRLVDVEKTQQWDGRGHFFAAAAEAMRRILVDQARRKGTQKAGGQMSRVDFAQAELQLQRRGFDLFALDEAIEQLEAADSRAAQVVKLRFFAGLTVQETADATGVSLATTENDWSYAKAWLRSQLSADRDPHT